MGGGEREGRLDISGEGELDIGAQSRLLQETGAAQPAAKSLHQRQPPTPARTASLSPSPPTAQRQNRACTSAASTPPSISA